MRFQIQSTLAVLLCSALFCNAQQIINTQTIPQQSKYQFTTKLASTRSSSLTTGQYTLSYTIQNQTLSVLLMLSGYPQYPQPGSLNFAWMAIGFGNDMRRSDGFIFCTLAKDGAGVQIAEYDPAPGSVYDHPQSSSSPTNLKIISGGYTRGIMFAEFSRPLAGDANHPPISTNLQKLMWAFNPTPDQNAHGQWISYHGPNVDDDPFQQTHGLLNVNFQSGVSIARKIASFNQMLTHGLGMAFLYTILMTLAIYIARYFKFRHGWFVVHSTLMIAVVIGTYCFFMLILVTYVNLATPHAGFGLFIITIVTTQGFLGSFIRSKIVKDDIFAIKWMRRLHWFTGSTIILFGFIQTYLGLSMLFPTDETRGKEYYVLLLVIGIAWIVIFGGTEVSLRRKMRARTGPSLALLEMRKEHANKIPAESLMKLEKFQQSNEKKKDSRVQSMTKKYTWEEIDTDVRNGKILVVSNGKYVYDASQWIKSHPGGKLILHAVSGTDISLDYFKEAGFDASQFMPKKEPPQRSNTTRQSVAKEGQNIRMRKIAKGGVKANAVSPSHTTQIQQRVLDISEEEWNYLVRSRRTHVHSELAIKRLSTILVGEIDAPYSNKAASDEHVFSPFEFRRYGLTSKEMLTTSSASSCVWKLKFTMLYPFEERLNQPRSFQVGESVEIQARMSNGDIVSRFYTPISGNLASFEVIVKTIKDGVFSTYLNKQRLGDKQFKIRGPLGSSFVTKSHKAPNRIPQNFVFIAAGSGITPFIQLLKSLVLPENEPMEAFAGYTPSNSDEIELRAGDFVTVTQKCSYYDGWAYGTNLTSQKQGVFPLSLCQPPGGLDFHITLINCVERTSDIIGGDIITGAMLAYPEQFSVHHIVSNKSKTSTMEYAFGGNVIEGVLTESLIKNLVGSPVESDRRAVVCGTPAFNSMCVDTLVDSLEWDQRQVQSLSSSTVN